MMKIVETPKKMVVNGQAVYGRFKVPFRDVNLQDQKVKSGCMPLLGPFKKFRLKEWEHVAIVGTEVTIGCAMVDAKYAGNSWFWAADRKTGKFVEHAVETPGWAVSISKQLYKGKCAIKAGGYKIDIDDNLDRNEHSFHVEIAEKKGLPAIRADFVMHADWRNNQPLVVVLPAADGRPLYTHKVVCPVSGVVAVGNQVYQLEKDKDLAILDVHKSYYPYSIFWEWATFGGYDEKGRLIGLNLCHNLIKDDETYNENCLWVDGKMTNLAPATFEYDKTDHLKPWHLKTVDGSVDLEFRPEGKRDGLVDFKVILSDYHQPYGSFHGYVTTEDGERIQINGLRGVTEDHKARF
jgi:hypothetical protein